MSNCAGYLTIYSPTKFYVHISEDSGLQTLMAIVASFRLIKTASSSTLQASCIVKNTQFLQTESSDTLKNVQSSEAMSIRTPSSHLLSRHAAPEMATVIDDISIPTEEGDVCFPRHADGAVELPMRELHARRRGV
jgi:hypothetical protein